MASRFCLQFGPSKTKNDPSDRSASAAYHRRGLPVAITFSGNCFIDHRWYSSTGNWTSTSQKPFQEHSLQASAQQVCRDCGCVLCCPGNSPKCQIKLEKETDRFPKTCGTAACILQNYKAQAKPQLPPPPPPPPRGSQHQRIKIFPKNPSLAEQCPKFKAQLFHPITSSTATTPTSSVISSTTRSRLGTSEISDMSVFISPHWIICFYQGTMSFSSGGTS